MWSDRYLVYTVLIFSSSPSKSSQIALASFRFSFSPGQSTSLWSLEKVVFMRTMAVTSTLTISIAITKVKACKMTHLCIWRKLLSTIFSSPSWRVKGMGTGWPRTLSQSLSIWKRLQQYYSFIMWRCRYTISVTLSLSQYHFYLDLPISSKSDISWSSFVT